MKWWTTANPKVRKGEKRGFRTLILHLAPAHTAGLFSPMGRPMTVCPSSTPECRALCLNTAGRGVMSSIQQARVRRTHALFTDREGFISQLSAELEREQRRASKLGLQLVCRPNGTSDLPWLAAALAERHPDVRFYDYTKVPRPWERQRPNYTLTFSRSESNWRECEQALAHGVNVAVVFDVKKGHPLPTLFAGRPVLDGDVDDLRFLDAQAGRDGLGNIVGLRAKGRARGHSGGFVVPGGVMEVQVSA